MTVVIAILGLIFLIVIHEMGHMLTAKALGVHVPEFSVGFGPALLQKKIGRTVYSFRIVLLGGFARMAGMDDEEKGPDTYPAKPPWRRALIILAGPFTNILASIVILALVYMFSGVITGASMRVESVVPHSFAAQAGVKPGDRIIAFDGDRMDGWSGFQKAVSSRKPGEKATLVVSRDGHRMTFSGRLGKNPDDPRQALVGVQPQPVRRIYGPLEATGLAASRVWFVTEQLGSFVGQLASGQQSFSKSVSGPIGIVAISSESVSQGYFFSLLSFISLNLGLFNLIPLLPLDGGHLLVIAAEKVRGRPVSKETVMKIAAFGLTLLLAVFLFATYGDLSKLFDGRPFIPNR
ncbi:M50 family metallopeptidase [Rubrobacter calidifluminis]|uniref:M50 family metallopeptidase n=1 Tax=Rubrobacter calidifluminis TaxID=1392640 RepID=UPI00235F0DF0|nr:site-2 protease family protein [Rubrobacter calidifluminis]